MTRVPATAFSTTALLLMAGCLGQATYDSRMADYLKDLKFEQRLGQYLAPPAGGRLQELGVVLRPPKELSPLPGPVVQPPAGLFEAAESFAGETLGLHVLARLKNPPKPQVAEGEEPPPPVARSQALATDVDPVVNALAPPDENQPITSGNASGERGQQYTRRSYTAVNGNKVDIYYYQSGDAELALIFVYPPAAAAEPAVAQGIPMTLSALKGPGSA